ncbi:chemotaxis protein CheD [Tateyamaria omphalii]|uniref:chemotaxis protein CheD n=1 Tax=Tateyamaria omphalii TaxID=299262 RepID=UPI001C992694|nr:chemotaxis protein CheD [Tateyamaria omphalii]MBY5932608.1 chemotaxis protein CheD [Tateyamaria omphalii]
MTDQSLHITQGEHATGTGPHIVISTLLGSCVACCLWDPVSRVGGMNHMLLAHAAGRDARRTLSGINAMELLINDLVKLGADRSRLCAKVFGGARMVTGLSDIGAQNVQFTLDYLAQEEIPLITHSLGGNLARNIRFWPGSGRAMQKMTDTAVRDTEATLPIPAGNGLELF